MIANSSITTVWQCDFTPSIPTATCLVTSTSPGYKFPGTSTSFYPSELPDAFPTYLVDITAGSVTGAGASKSGSLTMSTAAMSASMAVITSELLSPPSGGSSGGSANDMSTAESSTSVLTTTGILTSMTGIPSLSIAVVTSAGSSATKSAASSSITVVGPQKTGAASIRSPAAGLTVLISALLAFLVM